MPIDERLAPLAVRIEGVSPGAVLLILLACIVAVIGLVFLSNATAGVGVLTIALMLVVLARIVQAGAHHKAVMKFWTRHP